MSYPAHRRSFLRDVFLHHEGGYVKTGSMHTLFGVIDTVWVDALDRVSVQEIGAIKPDEARDQLLDIKALPRGQRIGPMREWMQAVGRELQPIGNGAQPKSGTPRQSKEYAREGGDKQLVYSAQEIALGIIYRDYMKGPIESLQVDDKTLFTVVDAFARHGKFFGYGMMGRAIVDSGIASEVGLNTALLRGVDKAPIEPVTDAEYRKKVGYVKSQELPDSSKYKRGENGYPYTLTASWPEMTALINRASPAEKDLFFDAFGSWRRSYIRNQGNESIKEGDLKRIFDHHGEPSAALARIAVAKEKLAALRSASPAYDGDVALVQIEQGVLSRSVAVQLPGDMGVVRYSVKYEDAYVYDDHGKPVVRNMPLLDEPVGSLPAGVELVREGESSKDKSYRNPYTDGDVLFWREPGTNKPQYLPIGGQFNDFALKLPTNTAWYSRLTFDDTVTTTVGDKTTFDPMYSAQYGFDASNPAKAPNWKPPQDLSGTATVYLADAPLTSPDTPKELAQNASKGPTR